MNLEQLAKHQDKIYELRPRPLVRDGANIRLARFNEWRITVLKQAGQIQLRCLGTGHQLDLGLDNFKEYRSPKFLLLKCQLIFEGAAIHIEPLPHGVW